MGPKTKIEVTPEVTRQLATRRAMGIPLRELEEEFGFSRPVINRILSSEMGRTITKEIIDTAVTGAVLEIRREMTNMKDLVLSALQANLEKNDMDAVKTYFKVIGMEVQEKREGGQNQAIQVIFPGTSAPKEVTNDIDVSEGH